MLPALRVLLLGVVQGLDSQRATAPAESKDPTA
jgi:hypothetical protein